MRIICLVVLTGFSVVCSASGEQLVARSQWLQNVYRGLLKRDLNGLELASVADLAQLDRDGWSLARRAAFDGRLDVLEILEAVGVNIRAIGNDGKKPQDYADFAGHMQVVSFLRTGNDGSLRGNLEEAILAVIFNDQRLLERLLAGPEFNINAQNDYGQTLAHYAALFGRLSIARLLATKGINLMLRDNEGQLAFDIAVQQANDNFSVSGKPGLVAVPVTVNLQLASLLLEYTVGIDKKDYKGWPPINFAIVAGDRQRMQELICKGAKLGEGCQNALEIALVMRDIPTFEFLLEHTEIDVPSRRGDTALMGAAKRGDKWVSDTLISYGANTNIVELEHGNSILILTAEEGHTEIVETLLDHDAEVNKTNYFGDSAVIRAAFNGHLSTVNKLFEHNADPNIAGIGDMTGLMWAAYWGDREMAETFIANGARRALVSKVGNTAGQWAKLRGHDDLAEMLGGGDGFVTTENIDKQLQSAVQSNDEAGVLRALAYGANADAQDETGDPLIVVATRLGFKQVVKALLSYRANANAVGREGFSVLMIASQLGQLEIVEPLLIAGASRQTLTLNNDSAESLARTAGHEDIVEALQQDWE